MGAPGIEPDAPTCCTHQHSTTSRYLQRKSLASRQLHSTLDDSSRLLAWSRGGQRRPPRSVCPQVTVGTVGCTSTTGRSLLLNPRHVPKEYTTATTAHTQRSLNVEVAAPAKAKTAAAARTTKNYASTPPPRSHASGDEADASTKPTDPTTSTASSPCAWRSKQQRRSLHPSNCWPGYDQALPRLRPTNRRKLLPRLRPRPRSPLQHHPAPITPRPSSTRDAAVVLDLRQHRGPNPRPRCPRQPGWRVRTRPRAMQDV
jgi:hypothetical protein